VTQLINADVATTTFATPERLFIGGAAGKVIRWAYQQQGLYADPATSYPVDAPGLSQDVDIYIDDRDARHGGYEPLRYLDRDWHAARSRMLVVGALGDTAPLSKAKAGAQAFLLVFSTTAAAPRRETSQRGPGLRKSARVGKYQAGTTQPGSR
jgi:hypothetical protein